MNHLEKVYNIYKERFPDECGLQNIYYMIDKGTLKLYFILGNIYYCIGEEDKNINNIIELIKSW